MYVKFINFVIGRTILLLLHENICQTKGLAIFGSVKGGIYYMTRHNNMEVLILINNKTYLDSGTMKLISFT